MHANPFVLSHRQVIPVRLQVSNPCIAGIAGKQLWGRGIEYSFNIAWFFWDIRTL